MEKKIDIRSASPEIIEAIMILADAMFNLEKENEIYWRRNVMKDVKETEKHGQAINGVTFEALRDRLIELARDGKREMVRALLDRHGVRLLTELPREKYGEVYLEVEKW